MMSDSLSWDMYVEEVLILKEMEPGANDPVLFSILELAIVQYLSMSCSLCSGPTCAGSKRTRSLHVRQPQDAAGFRRPDQGAL